MTVEAPDVLPAIIDTSKPLGQAVVAMFKGVEEELEGYPRWGPIGPLQRSPGVMKAFIAGLLSDSVQSHKMRDSILAANGFGLALDTVDSGRTCIRDGAHGFSPPISQRHPPTPLWA